MVTMRTQALMAAHFQDDERHQQLSIEELQRAIDHADHEQRTLD